MRNEFTDALIGYMRTIIERYDAGDDEVIQDFEFNIERVPPFRGWKYPMSVSQSMGYRGKVQVSFFFPRTEDGKHD